MLKTARVRCDTHTDRILGGLPISHSCRLGHYHSLGTYLFQVIQVEKRCIRYSKEGTRVVGRDEYGRENTVNVVVDGLWVY